jgi:hypothetical protein
MGYLSSKQSYYRPEQAQRVGRGIDLLFRDLGARKGWVVSTTPRPLYSRKRPGTHCTGGWVGLRAGLDVCEKSLPHRDSIPGPSCLKFYYECLTYCVITSPVPCISKWKWNNFPWLLLISLSKKFISTILCVAVTFARSVCVAQQRNVMTYRMGGAPKTSALVRSPNENYCVREYNFPTIYINEG